MKLFHDSTAKKQNNKASRATKAKKKVNKAPQDNSKALVTADYHEPNYGIGDVMKLVHDLPQEDITQEINIVIRTILSFDVTLSQIVEDANRKELLTKQRLKNLRYDMKVLKQEMENRAQEIGLLEIGLTEMKKTKHHLVDGIKNYNQQQLAKKEKLVKKPTSKQSAKTSLASQIATATSKKLKLVK